MKAVCDYFIASLQSEIEQYSKKYPHAKQHILEELEIGVTAQEKFRYLNVAAFSEHFRKEMIQIDQTTFTMILQSKLKDKIVTFVGIQTMDMSHLNNIIIENVKRIVNVQ